MGGGLAKVPNPNGDFYTPSVVFHNFIIVVEKVSA